MLFIRCLITLIREVFSLHAEVLQNLPSLSWGRVFSLAQLSVSSTQTIGRGCEWFCGSITQTSYTEFDRNPSTWFGTKKLPKTTEWSCRSVQTFRCKTRSPSAGKSGHVSEQFKFSALQKNFFSTLTLNLKHPHFLPAASRGGKTYHHPTELHFYWTSSHSFNAGKENTQWNVSLFADSLNKT